MSTEMCKFAHRNLVIAVLPSPCSEAQA